MASTWAPATHYAGPANLLYQLLPSPWLSRHTWLCPPCNDSLPGCRTPAQGCHTLPASRDTEQFLDVTAGAVVALLALGPLSQPGPVAAHHPDHLGQQAVSGGLPHDLEQFWLYLEQQDTGMWLPLSLNTYLALTLLKLAMPTSLQYVNHLIDVGKAITRAVILEVCGAL
ncbi:hypothetical protein Y1Q_0015444 [Alligator mississippiensis]|uniref:Uncharacterized protein n=1 Tax=Alligator mississippiensis TaxID=8496 RepID=A0A151NCZ3_ALLMI|nr:hypothetical protein Y1Q_0015444 [Alligator mississippiensis]